MGTHRIILSGIHPPFHELRWESETGLRIGRRPNLEIVVDDASVAPLHAEVFAAQTGWAIRDLGSPQGTYVSGERVEASGRKLSSRDVIRCGILSLLVTGLEGAQPLLKTSNARVKIQAATHRSWEQALAGLARGDEQWPQQGKHLLTLLRAGHYLRHIASPDELLQSLLDDVVAVLEAQRGCIVLRNADSGQLDLNAVSIPGKGLSSTRCYSRTLARRSFNRGESLLCQDVNRDAELQEAGSTLRQNMSSIICALLRSPRGQLGVLHLDRGPFQEPFTQDDFLLADAIAASVSAGIESAQLVARQRDMFLQTVATLARAVELRDRYTGSHTQRVTDYALLLAEELQLPTAEREHLRMGTPLHDIGKIGISDALLQKPSKLTAEEFEQMQAHTVKGADMLKAIPGLGPVVPIIRHHHEHWDGKGYPDRLAGERISPLARIVAVADAFDAMTSDRPYRPALPIEKAFAEIAAKAGTHFAPECAQAFLRLRPTVSARLQ